MTTPTAYKDFDPNHVVVGKGRGLYNHPANAALRNRIIQTKAHFEAADKAGKRLIAAAIVDEVLEAGGAFVKVADGQTLTREAANRAIRNRYTQERNKPASSSNNNDGGNAAAAAAAFDLNNPQEDVLDQIGAAIANNLEPDDILLGVAGNEVVDAALPDMRMDDLLSELGMDFDGKREPPLLSRAKNDLLERLSGDNGDALANCLLSILDLANENEREDSEATKEAFRSLASCKPHKRLKQGGDDERTVSTASLSQDDDSQLTASKRHPPPSNPATAKQIDSDMASVTSGIGSMTVKTDYIRDLDVVSRLPVGDEKLYCGTVRVEGLKKIPHGLGFMTYRTSNRWSCGHWRDGKLHGLAAKTYDGTDKDKDGRRKENGHRCIGIFSKNGLHGKAAYLSKNWRFLGKFKQNRRDGKGFLMHYHMGTYDGNFLGDKFVNGKHTPWGKGAKHIEKIIDLSETLE